MTFANFWIRRFALIFTLAIVALLGIQALRDGVDGIDIAGSALWSAITALLVASFNTWWAWRHGCRLK